MGKMPIPPTFYFFTFLLLNAAKLLEITHIHIILYDSFAMWQHFCTFMPLNNIVMQTKNEEKWLSHYKALRCYLEANHQLPDKKKVENRGLLNWWKYNKKLLKAGQLTEERLELLRQLNALRYNKLLEL